MARSPEGEKWSPASSDLGSSFGCEGDLGSPQDLDIPGHVDRKVQHDSCCGGDGAVTLNSLDDASSLARQQNRNKARGDKCTVESKPGGELDSEVKVMITPASVPGAERLPETSPRSVSDRKESRPCQESNPRHPAQSLARQASDRADVREYLSASRHHVHCSLNTSNIEDTFYLPECREHQTRSSSERSFGRSAMSTQTSVQDFLYLNTQDDASERSPSPVSGSCHRRAGRGTFVKSLSVPASPARERTRNGHRPLTTRHLDLDLDRRSPNHSPRTPPPIPRTPPRGPRSDVSHDLDLSVSSVSSSSSSRLPRRGSRHDLGKSSNGRCTCATSELPQTQNKRGSVQDVRRMSNTCQISTVCTSTGVPASSKETLTSRRRYELNHQDHGRSLDAPDTYLTPSQRKELLVKDLRSQVKILERLVHDKEEEIENLRRSHEAEKDELRAAYQQQIRETESLASVSQTEVTSLKESHEESVKTVASLQQVVDDLKKEMAEKETKTEQMFLEMYNKGRESASFEREEELELLRGIGKKDPKVKVTITDLRNKLVRTQAELAKWQTIRRYEAYHRAPTPSTEAETTLSFLKDSVFHYLTDNGKVCDDHLRAIVRILRFSEVEKQTIAQAVIDRRNRSATGLPH